MKLSQSEQVVFTFTDMKHLFLRHRKRILSFAIIGGLCILILLLLRTPQYKIEATFKQANKEADFSSQMKKTLQHLMPIPSESSIIAVMQSNKVIKNVVEKQGIQVVCGSDSLISRVIKRVARNFYLELGGSLPEPNSFRFANASYSGERLLKLRLGMKDAQTYQLFDGSKNLLGEAKLGEPLSFPSGCLTLISCPNNVKTGTLYPISVHPLNELIKKLKSKLKVSPHKLDKNILELTFFSPDRGAGVLFLNSLMYSYQDYLVSENDETCKIQLQYLKGRQEEVLGYYNEALVDHAGYLQENLEMNGYIGFEQEIATLSEPKNLYTSKLFHIDLELKRLRDATRAVSAPGESFSSKLGGKENLSISNPLEQERKKLERELSDLRQDEFVGLTLETAQQLLVEYTRQRDSFQAQIKEFGFLAEQLGKPGFEVSSLGDVYNDGVVREQVNKASAIALQLQDENNRSTRDHERLAEALQTQKNFLSHYLLQTVELKKLRVKVLNEKIAFLQQATLSLLQTEKDLLKNKLHELNGRMEGLPEKWRRESLFRLRTELWASTLEGVSQMVESKFLGQQVFQSASGPLDLATPPLKPQPPKALLYALLATFFLGGLFYFFLFCSMLLRGIPISDHMLRLLGLPVGGRLSGHCNTSLSKIGERDLHTIRHVAELIVVESKYHEGLVVAGIAGDHPDYSSPLAELLAMRGVKTIVLQCVFNKPIHPDAEPGFLQYLQGEVTDLPIKRHLTYDMMTTGGTSRHGAEVLCTPQFQSLLSQLKKQYEVVLLYSNSEPAKIEGALFLNLADVALVTVQQETKETLEVYQEWASKKEDRKISFLYAEEFNA